MSEKQGNDNEINSENIFDEFANSENIQNEVEQVEQRAEKNIYYYLEHINKGLLVLNILVFFIVITILAYLYVQENEEKTPYDFLNPICSVFLGDSYASGNSCYSVNSILSESQKSLELQEEKISQRILPLLGEVYSLENFNLSKKVSFILEKSDQRLKPLDILTEFDRIKNKFSPTDKGEISCYDITIASGEINISCDAFSSDWNTDIVSLDEERITELSGGGTSISRASSFLYFIENLPDSRFEIIEKPSTYTSQKIQLGPYTQKTTFQFKLGYMEEFNLSF